MSPWQLAWESFRRPKRNPFRRQVSHRPIATKGSTCFEACGLAYAVDMAAADERRRHYRTVAGLVRSLVAVGIAVHPSFLDKTES